eukprot:gene13442-15842_t
MDAYEEEDDQENTTAATLATTEAQEEDEEVDTVYWRDVYTKWHAKLMKQPFAPLFIESSIYLSPLVFDDNTLSSTSVFVRTLKEYIKDPIYPEDEVEGVDVDRYMFTTILSLSEIGKDIQTGKYGLYNFEDYKNDVMRSFTCDQGINQDLDEKCSKLVTEQAKLAFGRVLLDFLELQAAFRKRKAPRKALLKDTETVKTRRSSPTSSPAGNKRVVSKKKVAQENERLARMTKKKEALAAKEDNHKFSFEYIMSSIPTPPDSPFTPPDLENMTLYSYQQNTLARMIERETTVGKFDNPLYRRGDNNLYVHLINGSQLNTEPDKFDDIRGGILCEEMGTGKTIICISLILATRGSHPVAPPHWDSNIAPVRPAPAVQDLDNIDPVTPPVPSMKYQCARAIILKGVPYLAYPILEELKQYIQNTIPATTALIHRRRLSERAVVSQAPDRKLLFAPTTLVIAPNQILYQWAQELTRHTAIRFLMLQNTDKIPNAYELAKYDVILLSHTKISTMTVDMWDRSTNPIMGLYWLRMIVDEGHVVGNGHSKLSDKTRLIMAERRWVCSGTPISSAVLDNELSNFASIMAFLHASPFDTPDTWTRLISKPIRNLDTNGIDRLVEIVKRMAIRTPLDKIAASVQLPPLTVNNVIIDPTSEETLVYNQLVCQVQTNLLASQYEGPDSLFYAGNFNQEYRVIVMNTDMAAFGINMTAATNIILVDPLMSASKEKQAIKRAHRIGQTSPVLLKHLDYEKNQRHKNNKKYAKSMSLRSSAKTKSADR